MPRPLSLILSRLLAVLLLATVAFQAGAPFQQPLERSHGSAFSAATHEVALGTRKAGEAARQAIAPQPLVPAPMVEPASLAAGPLISGPAPRPHSTGPPRPPLLALFPGPRAPPA